jgi:alkylhydroperoxidase family enzyme
MSDIESSRRALVARLLEGEGRATAQLRRGAFEGRGLPEALGALAEKVARSAHDVTDADFAAARAAGFSEDQIFEIVVCAAVGEATRQHEAALAALHRAGD